MSCYIGQYVKTCDLCLRTKAQRQPPIGELAPLPIPEVHWDIISIDFIIKLLESHGYNAVMNVVDSVSKVSHFIQHILQSQPSERPACSLHMSGNCTDS